jgi:molybdate transport system substrate-binding protein
MRNRPVRLTLLAVALSLFAPMLRAAEVTLLTSVAYRSVLVEVLPAFERQSGHHVSVVYDSASGVAKRIAGGDAFDVVITTDSLIDDNIAAARLLAASRQLVGRARAMVAYRAGSPVPDVSSDEKFRDFALGLRAIAASDPAAGGASSVFFQANLRRLGLDAAVNAKLVLAKPGEGPRPMVEGRADYAIALTSEVAAFPGVKGVLLFPERAGSSVTLVAALAATSQVAEPGQALIAYLASAPVAEVAAAKGLSAD